MLGWFKQIFSTPASSTTPISTQRTWDGSAHLDHDKWQRDNWNSVPQDVRDACIKHLHVHIPFETLNTWKAEYEGGEDIGGHLFHFGGGMAVRNLLREVLTDDKLPGVFYKEHNEIMHNWDDYYIGALQDALEKWHG